MKILVVGITDKNIQLRRLREEAQKRGHDLIGCLSAELSIVADPKKFNLKIRNHDITKFDLIYLWAMGKRRWEWYVAAHFLSKNFGTKIVNRKVIDNNYLYYLTPAIDYLRQIEYNLPLPKTAIILSPNDTKSILNEFKFPIILKVPNGRQGRGVFKIKTKEELLSQVKNILATEPSAIIREFIPNNGDIRIFTVGYKAIGGMKRTPPKGDFRSNISQGGSGEPYDLKSNPEVKKIAENLSFITQTEIAGVDIMLDKNTGKPYVLEINPGPQFEGLEKFTGVNAAGKIISYFETL